MQAAANRNQLYYCKKERYGAYGALNEHLVLKRNSQIIYWQVDQLFQGTYR